MASKTWSDICNGFLQRLKTECNGHIPNTSSFDEFQISLERMSKAYNEKNVAKFVHDKLAPCFLHIRSFEKAITSATQTGKASSLVWSGTQIVIEMACRFSADLDTIFGQLESFYKALPIFDEYLILFPEEKRVGYALQDIFEDYANFCVSIIKYMRRTPLRNILSHLIPSGQRSVLQSTLKSLKQHRADFDEAVQLAHRKVTTKASRSQPQAPATVPLSTVSLGRNKFFFGRTDLTNRLRTLLTMTSPSSGPEPASCLLYGMGGIGKTQIALHYAYEFDSQYKHQFWVSSESANKLLESFGRIARRLIASGVGADDFQPSEAARKWLEMTDDTWILIFDNVESWDDIAAYWPTTCRKKSAIIATSQVESLKQWTTHNLAIGSMSDEEGMNLLMNYIKKDPRTISDEELTAARDITHFVGGLPLAITHLAGYVSESKRTIADVRDILADRSPFVWKGKFPSVQHEKRLEIVWDLALDELPVGAKSLIESLAFLNPDGVSESVLSRGRHLISPTEPPRVYCKDEWFEMVRCLVKRCLVRLEEDNGETFLTIHRSLQHAILLKLDKVVKHRQLVFDSVFAIVRHMLPSASMKQIPDNTLWPQFAIGMPHVISLCNAFTHSKPRLQASDSFAQLLYDGSFYAWERDHLGLEGIRLLTAAEDLLNRNGSSTEGRLRANIHCIMGLLFDNIGISKRAQGMERRRECLRIRRKIYEQAETPNSLDELLLFNAANDYGFALLQADRFAEAEEQFELCLVKYKEWGTEDQIPFEYAKYYMNTAYVSMYRGDHSLSREKSDHALALTEAASGRLATYWRRRYQQATMVLQSQDVAQALSLHLEVLGARSATFSGDSPWTLESYYTVGACYHWLGDLDKAVENIKIAVDRAKYTEWHREALGRAQLHLAILYKEKGVNKEDSDALEKKSRVALYKMLKLETSPPAYLQSLDDDPLTLYDHLQPTMRGKFTGLKLLPLIQVENGIPPRCP